MKYTFHLYLSVLAAAVLFASCNSTDIITGGDTGGGDNYAKVIEYKPAPGQFINDGMDCGTMEEAVKWAQERLDAQNKTENESTPKLFVSLGAFGGYITVSLAKPVNNVSGYDFGIMGNAHDGNSEPGIVWVAETANGPWYELKGSDAPKHKNYTVTYHRPNETGDIPWEDSEGNTGVVAYNPKHHKQMYYPKWIKEDSYTLTGSLLEPRSVLEGAFWNNKPYGWGYVDNLGNDAKYNNANQYQYNRFDISDAVDADGKKAGIQQINFIKVQGAIQNNVGYLGETSTEVVEFVFL